MKYTTLYLKYTMVVLLLLIVVVTLLLGVLCLCLGVFGSAQECNPVYLVFIPAGLFFGFIGVVAFDTFKYLIKKWELDKV